MRIHFLLLVLFLLVLTSTTQAQTFTLKGKVTEKANQEGIPGAYVQVSGAAGEATAVTDMDGNYTVGGLKPGSMKVVVSFIGFTTYTTTLTVRDKNLTLNVPMEEESSVLGEVEVVADIAVERSTPVAFSAVREARIQESLGQQDLPMILNETPGVYATQTGGGSGDSRISIRGFDQRNVAVMINGVPVNDMETGDVFWSNWDLSDVTKTFQVQRGLSASKLAQPSVGGTINIITKGFGAERGGRIRQEIGSNGYRKTSVMLSSGQLKGDWNVTVYGARRVSEGWVEMAFDDAWTYFGTISKRIGNHKLALTAMGSPQSHGQRSTFGPIALYSHKKALEFGADTAEAAESGFDFNPDWGYFDRYQIVNGDTIHNIEKKNLLVNDYHKPQINLNHFWTVSPKLTMNNVLYGSFGRGGSIDMRTGGSTIRDQNSLVNFTSMYANNLANTNPVVGDMESQSVYFLSKRFNNHTWLGFITSADYKVTERVTASLGIDGRHYTGEHYEEVYDLLGGDYARDLNYDLNPTAVTFNNSNSGNFNTDYYKNYGYKLREGDKFNNHYEAENRWLGGFGQLEYTSNLITACISGSYSDTQYKRRDFFKPKIVNLGDTTFAMPKGKTVVYNGQTYTWDSPEAKLAESDWVGIPGFTVKGGMNYNLTEHTNIFFNIGYINKPQFFSNFFSSQGTPFEDVENEKIFSKELGYGLKRENFGISLNVYHTNYYDRTSLYTDQDTRITSNIPNMNARHMGIELDLAQRLTSDLEMNAAISVGDWIWNSNTEFKLDEGEAEAEPRIIKFNAKGIHVGGAAQNQFMIGARYTPVKNVFIRPSFTFFSKHYIRFNPVSVIGQRVPQDTYRLPSQQNLNLDAGYSFKLHEKTEAKLNLSITNVLDQYYVTDVFSVAPRRDFDISTLDVFFNRGRVYSLSFIVDF